MNDLKKSDEELWQLVREDHENSFNQLMERYLPSLIHYGSKFSDDRALVQDCVQDILAELWMKRTRESSILSLRAYLFAAVRHSVCREAKKVGKTGMLDENEEYSSFEAVFSIEEAWIADEAERERLGKLNHLINRLPPRQKEIIYLRYYQGLEKNQIAEVLNIHYQSVSNLLHRTLTALRKQFTVLLYILLALKWP